MKKVSLENWETGNNEHAGRFRILINGEYLLELDPEGLEYMVETVRYANSVIVTVQPMKPLVRLSSFHTSSGEDYSNYNLSDKDITEFHMGEKEPVEFTLENTETLIGLIDEMSDATSADWMFF